jgi:hypothetical protein
VTTIAETPDCVLCCPAAYFGNIRTPISVVSGQRNGNIRTP